MLIENYKSMITYTSLGLYIGNDLLKSVDTKGFLEGSDTLNVVCITLGLYSRKNSISQMVYQSNLLIHLPS